MRSCFSKQPLQYAIERLSEVFHKRIAEDVRKVSVVGNTQEVLQQHVPYANESKMKGGTHGKTILR